MKRFIFLLVTLMPVLVFAQKAKIDFTTTSHNFGLIFHLKTQEMFL